MLALDVILAVLALAIMLAASEVMVKSLSRLSHGLGFDEPTLGLVVAVGADAPEISTALVALLTGSSSIGVGVLEGSNIYNLAGLLGAGAVVGGGLLISRDQIVKTGGVSLFATVVAVVLIALDWLGWARISLALVLIICLGVFVFLQKGSSLERRSDDGRVFQMVLAGASIAVIVGAAVLLVHFTRQIIGDTHAPTSLMSVVALPISTSLPNTWAAASLARKRLGAAVISTAFNSNLINLTIGVGLSSLFLRLNPGHAAVAFDGPFLIAMTLITLALLWTAKRLSPPEGLTIVFLYVIYLTWRLWLI